MTRDVADFLAKNVVQGELKQDSGAYGKFHQQRESSVGRVVSSRRASRAHPSRPFSCLTVTDIKIRPTTELGDNNSIKKQKAAREEKTAFPNRGRKMPKLDDEPAPKA